MGCYTYFYDHEFEDAKTLKDSELNGLFQEIRNKLAKSLYIKEREYEIVHWFKKNKRTTMYSVYERQGHTSEVRELHVPSSHITKKELLAFLYGIINGNYWTTKQNGKDKV